MGDPNTTSLPSRSWLPVEQPNTRLDGLGRVRLRSFCVLAFVLLVSILAIGWLAAEGLRLSRREAERDFLSTASDVEVKEAELSKVIARWRADVLSRLMRGVVVERSECTETTVRVATLTRQLTQLSGPHAGVQLHERLESLHRKLIEWHDTFVLPASKAIADGDAVPAGLAEIDAALLEKLRDDLRQLEELRSQRLASLQAELRADRDREALWLRSIFACVMGLSGLLLIVLVRSIEHPVAELRKLTSFLQQGGRVDVVPQSGFRDFRELATSFAAMALSVQQRERQLRVQHADKARENEDLAMLNEFARYLHQVGHEHEIADTLVRHARRVTNARVVGLYLRHPNHPTFELVACYPETGGEPDSNALTLRQSITADECPVLRNLTPLRILDRANDLHDSCQRLENKTRCEFCLPLQHDGERIGTLHLAGGNPAGWSADALDLVTSLAAFTGPTVGRLRALEHFVERAMRDPLTGLYNRRYFEELLQVELEVARRHDTPLCLLVGDVDHFKAVNDRFGHDVGDEVLVDVAQVMRQLVRASDVVCRYGGEEFVIVLPKTDARGGYVIAEKLRHHVATHPTLSCKTGKPLPRTVSLGVAVFPRDAQNGVELFKAADLALYRAKSGGRDRVELFAPLGVGDGKDASPGPALEPPRLGPEHHPAPRSKPRRGADESNRPDRRNQDEPQERQGGDADQRRDTDGDQPGGDDGSSGDHG